MINRNKGLIVFIPVLLFLLISTSVAADDLIDLNYRSTDIKDVVRSLAVISGRNIVVDDSAQGEVTVQLEDVTFDEAFYHLLNIKDLDYKEDGNIIVVAQKDRLEELFDTIERKIIMLEHLETDEARDILTDTYPAVSARAIAGQQRMVLIGSEKDIMEVESFLEELDIPEEREIKVFNVENQRPSDLIDYVLDFYPDLSVQARDSVGDLMISGRLSRIPELDEFIADLDRPDREINQQYRARELSADELYEQLRRQSNFANLTLDIDDDVIYIEGPAGLVEEAGQYLEEIDEREPVITQRKFKVDYLPLEDMVEIISEFEDDLKISQNPTDRSLIVEGDEERLKRIANLVEEVDQPRKQVMLEARVEEVSHSTLEERGIDTSELRDFTTIGVNYGNGSISGVDINLPELFSFFDSQAGTQTLANPKLMTLDGQEASLVIADQVPIKVAERETETGRIEPEYEYRDVGITLSFTPTITRDNTIILEMTPEVSSLGREASDAFLPVIQTREIETQISLRDGETFAIGGLIQDEISEEIRSVPLLSDLPILGSLFSFREEDHDKTEVIIYITPRIIDIMDDTDDFEDHIEISGDDLEVVDDVDDEEDIDDERVDKDIEDEEIKDEEPDTAEDEEVAIPQTVEEMLAELFEVEDKEREPIERPGRDQLKQITFRARMDRRDDWPEVYNYELASEEELNIERLTELYNIEADDIEYYQDGNEYIYKLDLPGNQVYMLENEKSITELAEKTGLTVESLVEANLFENELVGAGEVVILPFD